MVDRGQFQRVDSSHWRSGSEHQTQIVSISGNYHNSLNHLMRINFSKKKYNSIDTYEKPME